MANIIFVLDNVRSAFNVGSIFRTADGLNFSIDLIGITPRPGQDKKLEKTSLSALEFVKYKYFENHQDWLSNIKNSNPNPKYLILSIEETKEFKTISLFDLKNLDIKNYENIYIILGHEINGVNPDLMRASHFIVKLPMYGHKNSLNVGTCAGILGYRIKELIN